MNQDQLDLNNRIVNTITRHFPDTDLKTRTDLAMAIYLDVIQWANGEDSVHEDTVAMLEIELPDN